jgi:hypothetical protein
MTDTDETMTSWAPAQPTGVEVTYVGNPPDSPSSATLSPHFAQFYPLFVKALVPEARAALRRLSELPFAIRVIADRNRLSDWTFDILEDVGEILIELDRHVIAHVMKAAPDGPSVVTVHVALDPFHAHLGPLCDCWWFYAGVRQAGTYIHVLYEANCSFCHPELVGEGG